MVYMNNEDELRELGVYSELNGLFFVVLMWLTFTDFFDNSNGKILPSFATQLIQFLSKHKVLHKILNAIIKSWFGKIIITILSYILVKKYSNIKKDDIKHLLDKISNIDDSKDDSIKKVVDQIKSNDYKLESLNEGLKDFNLKAKIRLFRHFFYSMLLRSFNRSIIKLRYGKRDDYVPNLGVVLLSPIDKCNLKCKGCVTVSDRKGVETPEFKKINYIIEQAKNLNVFHIVITGKGEPFCDQDSKDKLISLAKKHDDLNFLIYTNGTTLQEKDIKRISKLTNVYLILSVDGLEEINDERRGKGVYQKVINLMKIMKDYNMIFGYCSTVYRGNYQHVTSKNFVYKMFDHGCKFGVYLKFIPLAKHIPSEMLMGEDNDLEYDSLFDEILKQSPIPLADPNRSERKYGCRARQGTMIHIDGITGKVSPCVKTPYAPQECNIYNNPHKGRLLEILRTDFFGCYRRDFAPGKYCASEFCDEIDEFLNKPDMPKEEIEKMSWVKENLSKKLT